MPKKRILDCVFVAVLVVSVSTLTHFWVSDRLGVLRFIFPAQAIAAKVTVSCSDASPNFLKSTVPALIDSYRSTTNQVTFVDQEGVVHSCVSGWFDDFLISRRLNTSDVFRYASQTKLITAASVQSLIDRGSLSLDTKLPSVFSEIDDPADMRVLDITIENLLKHEAGFDRYETADPLFEHYERPWCHYNVSRLTKINLDYRPGERVSYSNVGYCILGKVIEKITGMSYRDYVESRYGLSERGITFVDGAYLQAEVKYDFRNSDFYGRDYFKYFDFYSLSSSAGLSGSSESLAKLIKDLFFEYRKAWGNADGYGVECDAAEIRSCYGFGYYLYKPYKNLGTVYITEGFLPGVMSLSVVNDRGEVLVMLSAGSPMDGFSKSEVIIERLAKKMAR